MKRSVLLNELAYRIQRIERTHPVRVAIDGRDAAGKTTLADELVAPIQGQRRPVIRASVDGFHHPRRVRYRRGATSPEGYYRDSFDYQALAESLLIPLGPDGSHRYRSAVFDYRTDSEVRIPFRIAEANAILLFDGVFLLRPELIEYWDFTVFVEASIETTLVRAERRDASSPGGGEEIRQRYKQRYIPGQQFYFAESRPAERADVVIDNNHLNNPAFIR